MTKLIVNTLKLNPSQGAKLHTWLTSIMPTLGVLTFLIFWVTLCISANLFVREAVVCSIIVAMVMCYRAIYRNKVQR